HEDLTDIICLSRNGRIVPPVFMPGTSLVVSEIVRQEMGDWPNLAYLPVEFVKLIDYPYQAGDFSYYDTTEFKRSPRKADPEMLINRLPDVPPLHATIGKYFEVVVAHIDQASSAYPESHEVPFEYSYLGDRDRATVSICPRLLEDY